MAISRRELVMGASVLGAGLASKTFGLSSGVPKSNAGLDPHHRRLSDEWEVIAKVGADQAIVLMSDMVEMVRDGGGRVHPGWGVTGCLLTTRHLGITEVDPLRYDLPISRAINPLRKNSNYRVGLMVGVDRRGQEILSSVPSNAPGRDLISVWLTTEEDPIPTSEWLDPIFKELNPSTLEELAAGVALFRPAPLSTGLFDMYRNRAPDTELLELFPQAEQILTASRGILIYQEQIIRLISLASGLDEFQADLFRIELGKHRPEKAAQLFWNALETRGWSRDRATAFSDFFMIRSMSIVCQAHSVGIALSVGREFK